MSREEDTIDGTVTVNSYEENNDSAKSKETILPIKLAVAKYATHYNMNHPKRGKCVIFNHDEYDGEAPVRNGAAADVENIQRTFGTLLGFTVVPRWNKTMTEINTEIEKLSKEDHTDSDCLCVFIMTHGYSNGMLLARDWPYYLDSVWQQFTGDKCPTLVGKPKLFFIQACRGSEVDNGIGVFSGGDNDTEVDSCVSAVYKIPTHADILIGHSSVDGYYSYRHPQNGSFYIVWLCKIIENFWETQDLMEMMTSTARAVAVYCVTNIKDPTKNNKKQMPSITSTLIRKLCFTRKKSNDGQDQS
ncbi:PREDICTED: caspase-1-like [Dufourea novaeangliae]|uniref:caspase-1-like n=1 Tax=Dufourea novaeangliae TaxID=178035 RepID=UPI000767AD51|nr:PREDICTED: caspase-1-like [Dufourea novaeangliae]